MMGRPKMYGARTKLALPPELELRCETVRKLRLARLGLDPPTADLYREAVAVGLVEMERVERGGAPVVPVALPAAAPVAVMPEELAAAVARLEAVADADTPGRLEALTARLEAATLSTEAVRAVFLEAAEKRPNAPTPEELPEAPRPLADADRVRALREAQGIASCAEAARLAGCVPSTWTRYEREGGNMPAKVRALVSSWEAEEPPW